ncbi:FAD-dependent oxidoreductase, partial [Mycobacterium sp. 852002-40037_SCH5390672]|uniref:FAD-dependent oxidoreductase n=1 Tax=Mycobacterium sp. 852002-40037_SCH5390672 TaxID=1834089 RepID=UPI000A46A479
MIRGVADFAPGMTIETDVAIVGAGPIGITTALELAAAGVQVTLIESGLDRTDRAAQELSAFDSRQDDYFHS